MRCDAQDGIASKWPAPRQFADLEFAIPVPRPTPYLNAREAFMYLVMFSTLYLSAYYLGSLVFELINLQFPDPTANDYAELAAEATLRWSVSTVVVAFPVFLYVAWLLGRELRADVTKRASKIRRQLTYLTLLVAAAFLIGDVTTLIYNFLGGDMTVRFVLKVVTVAIIAGAGFVVYLHANFARMKAPLRHERYHGYTNGTSDSHRRHCRGCHGWVVRARLSSEGARTAL